MGILMLIELAMNIAGINLVALLNQVSVWWHIVIVAAVVFLVFLAGKPDESGLTLFAIQPQDVGRVSWDNNLGFVNLDVRTGDQLPARSWRSSSRSSRRTGRIPGYDASAHVAEETVGARVASAWGLFLSVAVSAVVGFIFLLALTTHLPTCRRSSRPSLDDPATYSQYYFGGGVAVIDILDYNLGRRSATS